MLLAPRISGLSKLTGEPQINWSNYFAQNLAFYVPMIDGASGAGGTKDLVLGLNGVPTGASKPTWDDQRKAFNFTSGASGSSCLSYGAPTSPVIIDPYLGTGQKPTGPKFASWLFRFRWDGVANAALIGRNDNNSVDTGYYIGIRAGSPNLFSIKVEGSAGNYRFDTTGTNQGPVAGQTHTLIVTYNHYLGFITNDIRSTQMYLDGRPLVLGSVTPGAGTVGSDATQTLFIGSSRFDLLDFGGFIECVAIWKGRLLTAADALALTNNPYQMLLAGPKMWIAGATPLTRTLADSFTIVDTPVVVLGKNYGLEDSVSFSDSIVALATCSIAINGDRIEIVDGILVSRDGDVPILLTDSFFLSDLFTILGPVSFAFSDSFTLADVFVALGRGILSFNDVITILDSLGIAVPIKILFGTPPFTIQPFPTVDEFFNFVGPGENIVLSDNLLTRLTTALGFNDTLALLDSIQTRLIVPDPKFSDSFSMSDTVSIALIGVKTAALSDSFTLTDSLSLSLGSPIIPYIRRYLNDVQ